MNTENHAQTAAFLWSIADLLRGDFKHSQYARIILPFTLLRRMAGSAGQRNQEPAFALVILKMLKSAVGCCLAREGDLTRWRAVQSGIGDYNDAVFAIKSGIKQKDRSQVLMKNTPFRW